MAKKGPDLKQDSFDKKIRNLLLTIGSDNVNKAAVARGILNLPAEQQLALDRLLAKYKQDPALKEAVQSIEDLKTQSVVEFMSRLCAVGPDARSPTIADMPKSPSKKQGRKANDAAKKQTRRATSKKKMKDVLEELANLSRTIERLNTANDQLTKANALLAETNAQLLEELKNYPQTAKFLGVGENEPRTVIVHKEGPWWRSFLGDVANIYTVGTAVGKAVGKAVGIGAFAIAPLVTVFSGAHGAVRADAQKEQPPQPPRFAIEQRVVPPGGMKPAELRSVGRSEATQEANAEGKDGAKPKNEPQLDPLRNKKDQTQGMA